MEDGEIIVNGNAGKTGPGMIGGVIRVKGEISKIVKKVKVSGLTAECKGTIYSKDKKIWPRKKFWIF